MTQSEGNKQESGKKRKTDIGDVVGWIGAIWCVIAIIWQPFDFFSLHGYQVIAESLDIEFIFAKRIAVFICSMNITIYLIALSVICSSEDSYDASKMTAGTRVLITIVAIIVARLAVLLYALISNYMLGFYYTADDRMMGINCLGVWGILSVVVIVWGWMAAISEFRSLSLGRRS